MNILVCITHVPDTTTKISFSDQNTKLDVAGVQFVIGPYDDYALARAVELRDAHGGKVTVLNVGTSDTEPTIRKALAIGADEAIRVNTEPADSRYVAEQIVRVAREDNYDLILMGRESIDFNSGVVHGMVGELLGWPSVSPVMKLDIENGTARMECEIEGGRAFLEHPLPLVAGCQEPIAEWKIPNMRGIMTARSKPLRVIEPLAFDVSCRTLRYELPPPKGPIRFIPEEEAEKLIELLKNEAKVL